VTTGQVEDALGGEPYVVTFGGYTVPAGALALVSITRGRKRPDTRPDAAQLVLLLASERLAQLPITGDQVTVDLSPAARTYLGIGAGHDAVKRFRGRVTDLTATATGSVTGPARVQVVAVGPRARAAQLPIAAGAAPAELDGTRATRYLADVSAQDASITVGVVDVGTRTVAARVGAVSDAGPLLDELAVSSGGELVEQRDGTLAWHDADHRRNLAPVLTLLPQHVLTDSAQAAQGIAGLLNDLTLSYDGGGSVQVVDTVSADPVTGYGRAQLSLSSTLPDADAATSRAADLVGRYSVPRWRLERLTVELLRTVDATLATSVLGASFGQLIRVLGFPSTGPFPAGRLFIEGGQEAATRDSWSLSLAVSDYALTGGSPLWADLGALTTTYLTWDHRHRAPRIGTTPGTGPSWADLASTDPDLTWLGAAGWDVDGGTADRWLDQPADRSWTDTDPTTWAAYTGA
jgi:hypothetical protein